MKLRVLSWSLVAAILSSLSALADKPETELGKQMEAMNDAFKALRKETDPAKGAVLARKSAVWKNEEVLSRTNASNSRIIISLSKQRGFFMNGEEVAIDYPICSGIKSRPTPKGEFPILEKVVDKKSNRYGRIYDAAGDLVNGDADAQLDPIPEGGRFEGAGMRYWMRMTWDGVGHHIGPVKRYPASHACVRGPSAVMPIIYGKVEKGTKIIVE